MLCYSIGGKEIDYSKLIKQFGTQEISESDLQLIEELTQQPCHRFLRRNIFFSHRDLSALLQNYKNNKPFYLYTGRGPSTDSMHLGHLLPFIFTKYLQDAFKVPLVIMMSDDEKYFHQKTQEGDKQIELQKFTKLGYENVKDILAVGFDKERTFIFNNSEYMGTMYPNVARFQKNVTYNQLKGCFGVDGSDNCGKVAYPAIQAAPTMSTSFPHIFDPKRKVTCLVPCGILCHLNSRY